MKYLATTSPRIFSAPLCGYTTFPYRQILHRFSYDLIFTEMVSVDALYYGNEKTSFIYHTSSEQNRLGIQLFGSQESRFSHAVEKLSAAGQFNVFDINCGCPVNKVTKTGGGAALLKNPEKIYRILHSLTKGFPHLTFSAKIRIGINKDHRNYTEVSQAIEEGGASFLTVHGRTQSQMYEGDIDYGAIREIKTSRKIPVIGNGGIFGPKQAKEFLDKTGIDGIMIARGLIGAPWLANYVREYLDTGAYTSLSWREKISLMREHFLLEEDFSKEHGFQIFKKSGLAYLKGLQHGKSLRIRLALANSSREILELLDEILEKSTSFEENQEIS